MIKKHLRILFLILTLICYSSVFFSPESMWLLGFLSLAIPLVIITHLLFLILNISKLSVGFFYHLVAIIVGFAFIKATYSISSNGQEGQLKVLSYNVRIFNNYAHLRNREFISSKKMIGWALENDAQIKCFQEYYNHNSSNIFNVEQKLSNAGWDNTHFKIVYKDKANAEFGIAIFSKLPIVNTGEIYSATGEFLNTIFADIIILQDTVRIYNTHLQSMHINVDNVVNTDRLAKSYKETGHKLRKGFMSRARQIDGLIESIKDCNYKIVLCGDFNELPYSYSYFSIRKLLNNAFEKAGNGFGFTYNGKLFFLRIDNQFFSKNMNIGSFTTHRNIDYSDHFPLSATYSW